MELFQKGERTPHMQKGFLSVTPFSMKLTQNNMWDYGNEIKMTPANVLQYNAQNLYTVKNKGCPIYNVIFKEILLQPNHNPKQLLLGGGIIIRINSSGKPGITHE